MSRARDGGGAMGASDVGGCVDNAGPRPARIAKAIFRATDTPPMARPRFSWNYTGIRVRDLGRSIAFYRDLLGLRLLRRVKEPEHRGEFAMLEDPRTGQLLELNWYAADSPVARPYPDQEGEELDHLGFRVPDVAAAVAFLEEQGFAPVQGPALDDGYVIAFVKDPDGIWIELYQRLHLNR